MAKKLNSEINVVPEGLDSKKQKPLLERLGLIEPIIRAGKEDESEIMEGNIAVTAEVRNSGDNSDVLDTPERVDKNPVENLEIKQIFEKFGLETKETNTVYLIENFIKALPANLPADVKRQSIINLISASQLDIILLLKDGNKRLEVLNNYYEDFSNSVAEIIASNEKQIRKLNERIAYHNRIIEDKKKMQEDQKTEIEFEMQKISNIIDFIENKSRQ